MSRGTRSTPGTRLAGLDATELAAGAVPCLPFLPLMLTGQTLWFRDWSLYFVPMKALLAASWRAGELPLWDPAVRSGLPFLANPQTGVLYPPSVLLALFGLDPGLTLFLLLHLAAAGLGFYRLLREVRLPAPAALTGAMAFGCGGYLASLVNVLNNLQAAVWIPWTMLFALRTLRGGGRSAWAGLVASTALALLGGELQLAALGIAAAGVVALVERRPDGETAPGALAGSARVGLALLAAVGLVAVQLLPTAELVRESVRSAGLPFELAADDSLEPATLATVAFPRFAVPGDAHRGATVAHAMPWLLSTYAGLVVTWLAALGCASHRRRWTAVWIGLGAVGVALALGSHSPLFRLAYDVLPPFRSVRYPEKFLLLPALAIPALAAAGVEGVLAGRVPRRGVLAGVVVIVASGVVSLLVVDGGERLPARAALLHGVPVALAAAALLALAALGRVHGRVAAGLLCALVAVDLAPAARAVNPSVPWRFYDPPWAAEVLERARADRDDTRIRSTPLAADMEQVAVVTAARVFSNHYLFHQSLAPNLGQLYGWLHQDGLSGIETKGAADLIEALRGTQPEDADPRRRMRLLRLQSVGWLVTSFPLPAEDVVPVAVHPELPVGIVRLRDPLPRAYAVGAWEVEPQPRAALERALGEDFDPARRVVLDRTPTVAASAAGTGEPRIVRAHWLASRLRLVVDAPGPAVAVVTDASYPGWHARVDGRRAELLRANGYGRAVAVPAGRHVVTMEYRPASLLAGAAVSLFSGALIVLGLLGTRSRPPRRLEHPGDDIESVRERPLLVEVGA